MQKIYENFDGPYYLIVAKTWYNQSLIKENFSFSLPVEYYAAHFPGFPALTDLVAMFGINHAQAMVTVNLVASVGMGLIILKLAQELNLKYPEWIAGASLFFWPRMWAARSIGSPEALFIFFTVLSLLGFLKKKYWWAGLAGAGAVLTKSPGILLFAAYAIWAIGEYLKSKKIKIEIWPVVIMPIALMCVFGLYKFQTGNFWAYFNSGDNIHLQILPFKVFDSSQAWVGNWWLEDVLWIYLVAGIGVISSFRKNRVLGYFGAVFYAAILFVSHRDISRYALPLVPVVLIGLGEVWERKEVRIFAILMLIPMYFYTTNFLNNNLVSIANWLPFL